MAIGIGIVLTAIGAILRFAIQTAMQDINIGSMHLHEVNVHMMGNILMAVGIAGVLLSLLAAAMAGRHRDGAVVERERHA